ncbi:MAG: aminotransferase class I/II-fold pyridoxal phosphate-dependent enzyme [Ignavibacteriales bacterium]|nr:aminotransferase class I/II-fold pyridoxal phosphate-dependent enzyme [Ignavibacteriales bacterium]
MIYLDRNENQFGPTPRALEILRSFPIAELSNYSRDFVRGVKSVLSEQLAIRHGIRETDILLSYGSEGMLKQIVHCYLRTGETMLIPRYSWWYYAAVAQEVNGITKQYPLQQNEYTFLYDPGTIDTLIALHQPRIVLIASPNNPTGNSMPREDVAALLRRHPEVMFVLDEAYQGFASQSDDSVPRLVLEYPNLIILRTFSKLYGLAAMRIGYAFAGANYKMLSTYSARYLGYHALSEKLALAALDDREYYGSLHDVFEQECRRYYKVLNSIDGISAYESSANFILVRLPEESLPQFRAFLKTRGIAIKFFDDADLRSFARITIGTPEQNAYLLAAFREYFA